ncbi:MAG: adenylyl-sulfate kinase [Deltaproteobacteria bacterium]|nr:adenylyl-sulfate kinase [Deltaproteobacteria bacterium]
MAEILEKQKMNIVIAGHVDHGKSTVIGRLLADTGSLPDGKLEQVQENCRRNSKPFEYAFLIDALKDEQSQGITIDTARVFFKTVKRNYIILDAPGHIEFLKNMVTGAARAEAALLVIDADEGVRENSRRHGYMMSMLGIRQIAILVNKMDLKAYSRDVFEAIVKEYTAFLKEINVVPACFIPVSAMLGDNIAALSPQHMPWYTGKTVLDMLDAFEKEPPPLDKPFRMPVQDVYKFTRFGDNRRIVAGTIETGSLALGDEVVFYPSGKKSRVKTIECFNAPAQTQAVCGTAAGFTLEEQIYVTRGELATKAGEPKPRVSSRIRVNLFWLGRDPLVQKKDYLFKLGTARVTARLEEVRRVIDASDLNAASKNQVERHDVAECVFKLNRAIAFDPTSDIGATGRFVIVDNYEIRGGGIIAEGLDDRQTWLRETVMLRNYKWEKSIISPEKRAEKYNQKSTLLVLTGEKQVDRKAIAKQLEDRLFEDGKVVYFLGIGNVLYGIDADIKGRDGNQHQEHMRRLSEVANILLDAGIILLLTAVELTQDDLEIMKTTVSPEKIETVWVGENVTTDIAYDLQLTQHENVEESVDILKAYLQDKGIIFRPW